MSTPRLLSKEERDRFRGHNHFTEAEIIRLCDTADHWEREAASQNGHVDALVLMLAESDSEIERLRGVLVEIAKELARGNPILAESRNRINAILAKEGL